MDYIQQHVYIQMGNYKTCQCDSWLNPKDIQFIIMNDNQSANPHIWNAETRECWIFFIL